MNNKSDKFILLGYRNPLIKLYKPKMNNKKRFFLLSFVGVCLITPCTNWIIPVVCKVITKLNPLWIYK